MIYFLIPSIDDVLFSKLSFFDADSFDVAGARVKTKVELEEVEGVTQGQGHQTSFGTCFFFFASPYFFNRVIRSQAER